MSKKMTRLLALMLVLVMCLGLAACGKENAENSQNPVDSGSPNSSSNPSDGPSGPQTPTYTITEFDPNAKYTYQTYQTSLSSNWNPHDYEDSVSSDQLTYLIDGFYTFAFNDELHPHDDPNRAPYGAYVIIPSMASGDPIDVTMEVKAAHPDWIPADATSGYAWAIPMRQDLYFDTGYHITANSFVEGAKRLLDPKLQNYRAADVYSGSTGIVGAESFFKAGTYGLGEFVSEDYGDDEYVNPADFTLSANGTYQVDGKDVVLDLTSGGNWGSNGLNRYYQAYAAVMPNFAAEVDALKAAANDKGWVYLTPELLKNLQNAIAILQGFDDVEGYAASEGDYAYIEFEEMAFLGQNFPEVDFESTVGIYAKDEYTLVQVFKGSLAGFSLYYGGIQDSLLLVEPDIYDNCLYQDEQGTWHSRYMTSADTSPSYGPYSMTEYQTDKMIHYSRNDKWYGYHDDVNNVYKDPEDGNVYRLYQTTDIDIQVISTDTAKNMFLAGQLMTYSMKAADYGEYGFSDYLYANPGASVYFFLMTGDLGGLQEREAAADFDQSKYDLETITVNAFRRAVAISFDKQAACDDIYTSNTPAYGIFGQTQIYDPDTSGFYRETPQAKQALVDFYSIDLADYNNNLDAAVAAITGYDPDTAKALYQQAFEEALQLGYITSADGQHCDQNIRLYYAATSTEPEMMRRIEYLSNAWQKAVVGTPFEGKVSIEADPKIWGDDEWADAIKSGASDMQMAGWTGSLMNPYNLLTAYTHANNAYAANWYEPKEDMMTLTLNGEEITMSVYDWGEAVNGVMVTDSEGNSRIYGENEADQETRVTILAAVEGKILGTYTYIPFLNQGSKFLLTQKAYYVVEDYNPVLGRGGISYMKYNYNDADWEAYCADQIAQHGQLQY